MITSEQALISYTLTGSGQVLPIPFAFLLQGDITAISTNPTTKVDTVLILNTNYTISGGGIIPATGNLTMVAGSSGDIITIYRGLPETQTTGLTTNGPFPAKTIETTYDRLVMLIQRVQLQANRSLRIPNSNAESQIPEMTVALRAGKIPAFDTLGNLFWLPNTANVQDISNSLVTSTGSTTQRVLADRFAEVVNVLDFGASNLGFIDATAFIQAAITYAKTKYAADGLPRCVFLPAGKYKVSATITNGTTGSPSDGVSIIGAGMRSSVLVRSTDYGDTLKICGAYAGGNNVQGLGFLATGTVTSGSHLVVQQVAGSVISDLWLTDGFVGITIQGCFDIIFDRIRIWGGSNLTGTNVTGSAYVSVPTNGNPANPSFDVLFSNFLFRHSGTAKKTASGISIAQCDGIWFNNGHVIGANTALSINPPNLYTVQNIQLTQVFFDGNCQMHADLAGIAGSFVFALRFNNCIFGGADGTGSVASVRLLPAGTARGISFRNSEWGSNQAGALNLQGGSYIDVIGCKFTDNNLGSLDNVLTCGPSASRINIKTCTFGFQTAGFGIYVNGSANLTVCSNDFQQIGGTADISINALGASPQIFQNTSDRSTTLASAATLPVPNTGEAFIVSGTTGITALPTSVFGREVFLTFTGIVTLTNSGSLKLAGGVNYTTAANSTLSLRCVGGGAWAEVGRAA